MLALAIETSTRRPSVAVLAGGRTLTASLQGTRAHASDLLPTLAGLLGEAGAAARDVEVIAVGTGPGSYTGLRVGVATALGLARGSGAGLVGVPSGEALVWEHAEAGQRAVVLLDARAGALYFGRFERGTRDVTAIAPPEAVPREQLALEPGETVFCEADLVEVVRAAGARPLADRAPSAAATLELGLARLERDGPCAPSDLEPLYLRAFAARTRRR